MAEHGLECSLKASYPSFSLDVSFSIPKGELVSIIGPSGCGKTTTLQLISGLFPPEEGFVKVDGQDVSGMPTEKRRIAMVFQDYALFPQMSVGDNIAYALKLQHMPKKERIVKVTSLLDLVSLQGFQKRKPNQLSGGERQRVALARALASDPKLLLLDEPLSALDTKLRKHLRSEIRNIHEETGITMLYVTHDQNEAMAISDRIIVMHDGHVEQIGKPEEMYLEPQSLFVATFMGDGNTLPYRIIAETLVSEGNNYVRFTPKTGEQVIFFRPEQVTIQDNDELPFPEFLPHLELKKAKMLSCIFQGNAYEEVYQWKEYRINVLSRKRPKKDTATLGVRLTDIRQYLDGKYVFR